MHVLRSGSKISTPFSTSWMMAVFDLRKAASSCAVQWNFVFGLRRCLKGAIRSVIRPYRATWLTRPNHERTPAMPVGVGNALMASR